MGKDQDLLDAARCGNISVVERILNQRAKKSGKLASFMRGPGPNIQDSSGYTPLHHASLNGPRDIVVLLLNHEASSNVVDDKGCTPLHLASWSGNTEIVKLLLTHASSVPCVNQMNFDHESALHSAAQYGHTEIVKLLLQHNCYPSVRNVRNESPLDLASQYGRLETVHCLLNLHPELLNDYVRTHSPLHLASKNGHRTVVKALLDSGFDINFQTDIGTALHEAAMYGKIEVVKLLLDYGIDVNLENSRRRTVFDILLDLNTTIAGQIEDTIKDHMTLIKFDSDSTESVPPILPPHGFVTDSPLIALLPEKCSLSNISPPRQFCSPSPDDSFYDMPPPPKMVNHSASCANDSLSSLTLSHSQDSSFDQLSCSSYSPSKCDPDDKVIYENGLFQSMKQENIMYDIPPPPKLFSTKRFSDPLQQSSIYENVCINNDDGTKDNQLESYNIPTSMTLPDTTYIPMMPTHSLFSTNPNRPQPPAKPPRKSVSPVAQSFKRELSKVSNSKNRENNYEYLYLATSGSIGPPLKHGDRNNKNNKSMKYSNAQGSDYVDMTLHDSAISTYENHEVICANGVICEKPKHSAKTKLNTFNQKFNEILPSSQRFENLHRKINSFNNLMPSKSTPALHASRHTLDHVVPLHCMEEEFQVLKPNYLNLKQKRASIQIPTSPTNYQQPPTPDIPPPSPATAETGIHEKIRPINQEYRTKKSACRDIDTITDEQLVATIGPSGEVQLTLATDNKCISTERVELQSDNPFEGLCKGSVNQSGKSNKCASFVPSQIKYLPQMTKKAKPIYENVEIKMEGGQQKIILTGKEDAGVQNNRSSLSVMSPFDEKAEWAEIADIMASFGGGIARESMFAQDMESNFTQNFRADSMNSCSSNTYSSIEQWLANLSLSQYENLFIINGFDDINFLGGNIIEDIDLEEIGIENQDHRKQICIAAQKLPAIQPISRVKQSAHFPSSVDEWLCSISLQEYKDNFSVNNITDMDRALKLWEVELNTVLKITKIGHRKRILASLGDKHFEHFESSNDLDLSNLQFDLSALDLENNSGNQKNYDNITKHSNKFADGEISSRKSNLKIRPPTQLMSDTVPSNQQAQAQQSSIEAQWRHHPNDLIKRSCNYMAKYLGSTLVKELKGMESTKKSIQKLRSSSRDIVKIPNIILAISYSGVKFIDAETQQLVCEHEIRNIHCACQDADDLRHFAYITKDHQTHNHYCHVFSSNNVDFASEIILTLGQAFEVAYQIAVQEKVRKENRGWQQNSIDHDNLERDKSIRNSTLS